MTGFSLWKGHQTLEIPPCFFQLDVFADYINDIETRLDFIDSVMVREEYHNSHHIVKYEYYRLYYGCRHKNWFRGPVHYGRGEPQGKDVFRTNLLQNLLHPQTPEDFQNAELVVSFTWPYETGLKDVLVDVMRQNPDKEALWTDLSDYLLIVLGWDVLRKYLARLCTKISWFWPNITKIRTDVGIWLTQPCK